MDKLPNKIAIYGGSFNPPGIHHRKIVEQILQQGLSDQVIVIPCGQRGDKTFVDPKHRINMVNLGFPKIPEVKINHMNVEQNIFTSNHKYEQIFAHLGQLLHVIGADQLHGGEESVLIKKWEKGDLLFYDSNFIVIPREGYNKEDFIPPNSSVLDFNDYGSSSEIRRRIETGESLENLVVDGVLEYILENGLFGSKK